MTIITDSVQVKGGADFTFMCSKIPFAVSCTKNLPHGAYNYIDLDLINQMDIPLLNIKVTRMSILGRDIRAVGSISQTVQCVHKGIVQGTVHLEAKVVRNLFSMFNVDCIASAKTYTRLTGVVFLNLPTTQMSMVMRLPSSSLTVRMRRSRRTWRRMTTTIRMFQLNQILLMLHLAAPQPTATRMKKMKMIMIPMRTTMNTATPPYTDADHPRAPAPRT